MSDEENSSAARMLGWVIIVTIVGYFGVIIAYAL